MSDTKKTGLDLMRVPFPENQISHLPKPTKAQTDKLKAGMQKGDFSLGVRCKICGQWHHKDTVHLQYVGHAALTDRLLDCDPNWNWEPAGINEKGQPILDEKGGMWIKLTVCGLTRLGYGDAPGKNGGDAVKEVIGDALRNAAMRFGAALDLWHKGDLHSDEESDEQDSTPEIDPVDVDVAKASIGNAETMDALRAIFTGLDNNLRRVPALIAAKDNRKAALEDAAVKENSA